MITIIVALITAGVPSLTNIITARRQRSLSKMHSAKQSILQMQMEDIINFEILKKLPRNYTNIHYEYDNYKAEGGNSDIDIKMKEYEDWYSRIKGGMNNGNN